MKKLQLGTGTSIKEGWINTDGDPSYVRNPELRKQLTILDVTKPFIYEDNSIDFIYSEHMIEHITHEQGLFMLSECYRILKPGGVTRIATPNIDFIMNLTQPTEDNDHYIEFIARFSTIKPEPIHIINNAFRNWGHQFLYDNETLIESGIYAGFDEYQNTIYGVSIHPELNNIEQHGRQIKNERIAKLETIIVEFTK